MISIAPPQPMNSRKRNNLESIVDNLRRELQHLPCDPPNQLPLRDMQSLGTGAQTRFFLYPGPQLGFLLYPGILLRFPHAVKVKVERGAEHETA
ncbi:hypothetical protein M758_12G137000 [Ceratodon purpureus]|nr:hypothetical protein M758_12G137000 [Ceratodon purpureus]